MLLRWLCHKGFRPKFNVFIEMVLLLKWSQLFRLSCKFDGHSTKVVIEATKLLMDIFHMIIIIKVVLLLKWSYN